MNKLKIGMIALLMVISNMLVAQQLSNNPYLTPGKTAEENATVNTKKLVDYFGLDAKQEKMVNALCLNRIKTYEADIAKLKNDETALNNSHKLNNTKFRNDLSLVLNNEQRIKLEKYLATLNQTNTKK